MKEKWIFLSLSGDRCLSLLGKIFLICFVLSFNASFAGITSDFSGLSGNLSEVETISSQAQPKKLS